MPFWDEKYKAGNISYSNGYLTIKVDGFYYLYSQMAYCGKEEIEIGHYMSINGQPVLRSKLQAKAETTHNVGGVFKLRKNDKVTVSPWVTQKAYCFSPQEAYFGAFLVRK